MSDNNNQRIFTCETCNVADMQTGDFITHMKEAHGLERSDLRGTQQMLSHFDSQGWHSSTYRLTFCDGAVTVIESTSHKRSPESKSNWGG